MANEKARYFGLGFMLCTICMVSIGFIVIEPTIDNIRRELVTSRNDAERYHSQYAAIKNKLDESITIIDGSQGIIDGAIGTIQRALETIRECRRIISAIKSILQDG